MRKFKGQASQRKGHILWNLVGLLEVFLWVKMTIGSIVLQATSLYSFKNDCLERIRKNLQKTILINSNTKTHMYLGLPLGASNNDLSIWNSVLQRVDKRFAGWQKRVFVQRREGGEIKSTLSSIPTCFMFLFHAPISVTEKLRRLQRNFLWNSAEKKGSITWSIGRKSQLLRVGMALELKI